MYTFKERFNRSVSDDEWSEFMEFVKDYNKTKEFKRNRWHKTRIYGLYNMIKKGLFK